MAMIPTYDGDGIPIILHHSSSDTAEPALLFAGETAVAHGPVHTKFWIGDGSDNRLFLSTNLADNSLILRIVLDLLSTGTTVKVVADQNTILGDGTLTNPLRVALNTVSEGYVDARINVLRMEIAVQYVRLAGSTAPPVIPGTGAGLAIRGYVDLKLNELRAEIAAQYLRIAGTTPIAPPAVGDGVLATQEYVEDGVNQVRIETAAQFVRLAT